MGVTVTSDYECIYAGHGHIQPFVGYFFLREADDGIRSVPLSYLKHIKGHAGLFR